MMSSFLNFLISHNESIIQWLIVSIVVISGYLLAIMIFGDKKSSDDSLEASTAELKNTLTEILKNTAAPGVSGPGATGPSAGAAGAVASGEFKDVVPQGGSASAAGGAYGADLEKLKKELSEKQTQIAKLHADLEQQKKSAKSDGALEEKLKELEAKLAEYQILEDDIADLSAYKEENARLKTELQKLGGSPAEPAPATPSVAAEVSSPSEADIVATAALPDKPDDFVAEFEAAVEIEKGVKDQPQDAPDPVVASPVEVVAPAAEVAPAEVAAAEATKPPAEPPPKVAAAKTPEEEEEEIAESIGDDIFAEFAASIETPEVQEAIRQGLDTDKIMGELADLETAAANDSGDASALEQDIDTDKMASEATKLSGG